MTSIGNVLLYVVALVSFLAGILEIIFYPANKSKPSLIRGAGSVAFGAPLYVLASTGTMAFPLVILFISSFFLSGSARLLEDQRAEGIGTIGLGIVLALLVVSAIALSTKVLILALVLGIPSALLVVCPPIWRITRILVLKRN